VSSGCQNCYAEAMTLRLQNMGSPKYVDGFEVRTHPEVLGVPAKWKKPRRIFVCSMSDLFHGKVSDSFIMQVFDAMLAAPQHTYQVLTKRPERMDALKHVLPWPPYIWAGTTVENYASIDRIRHLRRVPAVIRFLSLEPLLGKITDLNLDGIHWVIVGGESGPEARPMAADWVRDVRDQCLDAEVSFFFKQWGGKNKKAAGKELDGRTWLEVP